MLRQDYRYKLFYSSVCVIFGTPVYLLRVTAYVSRSAIRLVTPLPPNKDYFNFSFYCAHLDPVHDIKNWAAKEHSDSINKYSEDDMVKMLEFLVDNIFVVFEGKVF